MACRPFKGDDEMYVEYLAFDPFILKVTADDDFLTSCQFVDEVKTSNPNNITKKTVSQLEEYFNGKRKSFDLPLAFNGTPFQVNVWKSLIDIPYGETKSYSEQADSIGNPKAVRAVGGANNKNKIAVIIPCHRVVGKSGKLVGYAGGIHIKKYLLELESRNK